MKTSTPVWPELNLPLGWSVVNYSDWWVGALSKVGWVEVRDPPYLTWGHPARIPETKARRELGMVSPELCSRRCPGGTWGPDWASKTWGTTAGKPAVPAVGRGILVCGRLTGGMEAYGRRVMYRRPQRGRAGTEGDVCECLPFCEGVNRCESAGPPRCTLFPQPSIRRIRTRPSRAFSEAPIFPRIRNQTPFTPRQDGPRPQPLVSWRPKLSPRPFGGTN